MGYYQFATHSELTNTLNLGQNGHPSRSGMRGRSVAL